MSKKHSKFFTLLWAARRTEEFLKVYRRFDPRQERLEEELAQGDDVREFKVVMPQKRGKRIVLIWELGISDLSDYNTADCSLKLFEATEEKLIDKKHPFFELSLSGFIWYYAYMYYEDLRLHPELLKLLDETQGCMREKLGDAQYPSRGTRTVWRSWLEEQCQKDLPETAGSEIILPLEHLKGFYEAVLGLYFSKP